MDNILLLGATSAMAKATAYLYASKGYSITLAARNTDRVSALASDISIKHCVECYVEKFDAEEMESHDTFFNNLKVKPDIVISFVGYLGDQKLAESSFEESEKIIQINYVGCVSILNIISEFFANEKKGVIVGIGSVAGDRGRQKNYMYCSAKAGFATYLDGLRNRMCKLGVHVMTVKPGYVYTKMTEGMELPGLLTSTPEYVAKSLYKAVRKKRNSIYISWKWRYVMMIIKNIPEFIFKKLNL